LILSSPEVLSAAPIIASGAAKAPMAVVTVSKRNHPSASRGRPQAQEYYRYYRPYWDYGFYQLYGTFGPIGYWGYFRPYEHDPWSWWKLP